MNTICKKRVIIFSLLLCSISYGNPSHAQSEHCIDVIVQDRGELNMQETQSLATAELIRRSRDGNKEWAVGVTVPFKGLPVKGNVNSAEEVRERFFRNSKLNWTSNRLVSVATQSLSKNAVDLYRSCVDTNQI